VEDVDRRIAAIRHDREHGATYLTMDAVRTLGDAAATCDQGAFWPGRLTGVAERLAGAKPTMAAVRNATLQLLRQLLALGAAEAPRHSQRLVEQLLAELQASAEAAAANAARLLPGGATFITCSYSSAVLRTARQAQGEGAVLRALVLEDASERESPGYRLAAELEQAGLSVEVISSAAGADAVGRAHLALVGADAVTSTVVVNGAPTLALAEAATGQVPLYVVCEMVKFIPDIPAGPGYDRVPLRLVKGIVTEDGLLASTDVEGQLDGRLRMD